MKVFLRGFLCVLCASAFNAFADKPNIILLFADDLGYGDLSCYGHPTLSTPNLDRMAAEGIRLTSFYSAPSCVPARVQLMTGRYPSRVDVSSTGAGGTGGLPDDEVTLAQSLKSPATAPP